MGLSLKKLGKGLSKTFKKVAKVVKKVAPIALVLSGVGGPIGAIATGALKTASKLKSKGASIKKAAYQEIIPAGIKKTVDDVRNVTTATRTASREPVSKTAAAPRAKKITKISDAKILAAYDAWLNSGQEYTWEDYAERIFNP